MPQGSDRNLGVVNYASAVVGYSRLSCMSTVLLT
jgi:hypothetical protein